MANGIPGNISGSAPLYLGSFTSQRGAMAQRMTDTAIRLAEKEQTRQAQERADMLKALSFDAVQGLGRKVQENHLEELNALQDKYAKRWIENGRKLTDRDYLDLQRDKTDMEQKIAAYKNNVAQYAKVADEIRQGKVNYHPSTLEAMKRYYENGDVGEDFTQYIKFMPDTYGFLNQYTDQINNLSPDITSVPDYENNTKTITKILSADKVRNALLPALQNNPRYMALYNSDPYTRKVLEESVNNYIKQFTQPDISTVPLTKSEAEVGKMKAMPLKYQKVAEKYGWQNMTEGEIANAMYFNDFAMRGLKGDPAVLEQLRQKAGYDKVELNPDKSITIVRKGTGNKPGEVETIPPTDWSDEDNVRHQMTKFIDYAPASMGGKQRPDNLQIVLRPDYEVAMTESPKATVYMEIQKRAKEGTLKGPDAANMIARLLPKERDNVTGKEKKTAWIGGFDLQKEGVKWGGRKYAFDNEKDVNDLVAKLGEKLGYTSTKKNETPPAETPDYTVTIGSEDSIAGRHNNPGNLMFNNQPGAEKGEKKEGGGYWAKFDSPEAGYEALISDIEAKQSGNTKTGLNGDSTLAEFISAYAPASDNNDTEKYISNVSDELGVNSDTKIKDIDSRELAKIIAKRESSTKVEEKETITTITSPEEYEKLKVGDRYIFNGQEAIKE